MSATPTTDHFVALPAREARRLGRVHYYIAHSCGAVVRNVCNHSCMACNRKKRRASYDDKQRESGRLSMAKWRAANAETALKREQAWREANPGKLKSAKRRRRIAQSSRTVWRSEWDLFVEEQAHELADLRTRVTGRTWHVDHMYPLLARTVSGLHCGDNIQVIPERLNRLKANKLMFTQPGEWVRAL